MIAAVAWALCLLAGLTAAVCWLATVLDRPRRTPGRHRGDLGAWMLSRHRVGRLAAEHDRRGWL